MPSIRRRALLATGAVMGIALAVLFAWQPPRPDRGESSSGSAPAEGAPGPARLAGRPDGAGVPSPQTGEGASAAKTGAVRGLLVGGPEDAPLHAQLEFAGSAGPTVAQAKAGTPFSVDVPQETRFLRVSSPGYRPVEVQIASVPADVGELRLVRALQYRGRLVMAERPVLGAHVRAVQAVGGRVLACGAPTDSQGRFALDFGAEPPSRPARSGPIENVGLEILQEGMARPLVPARWEGVTSEHLVQIESPGVGFEIRLVHEGGAPAGGVRVTLAKCEQRPLRGRGPGAEEMSTHVSDADGRIRPAWPPSWSYAWGVAYGPGKPLNFFVRRPARDRPLTEVKFPLEPVVLTVRWSGAPGAGSVADCPVAISVTGSERSADALGTTLGGRTDGDGVCEWAFADSDSVLLADLRTGVWSGVFRTRERGPPERTLYGALPRVDEPLSLGGVRTVVLPDDPQAWPPTIWVTRLGSSPVRGHGPASMTMSVPQGEELPYDVEFAAIDPDPDPDAVGPPSWRLACAPEGWKVLREAGGADVACRLIDASGNVSTIPATASMIVAASSRDRPLSLPPLAATVRAIVRLPGSEVRQGDTVLCRLVARPSEDVPSPAVTRTLPVEDGGVVVEVPAISYCMALLWPAESPVVAVARWRSGAQDHDVTADLHRLVPFSARLMWSDGVSPGSGVLARLVGRADQVVDWPEMPCAFDPRTGTASTDGVPVALYDLVVDVFSTGERDGHWHARVHAVEVDGRDVVLEPGDWRSPPLSPAPSSGLVPGR